MFKRCKMLTLSTLACLSFSSFNLGAEEGAIKQSAAKLSDFAGNFINWGYSVGGVTGAIGGDPISSAPQTTGFSQVNLSQSTTRKNGHGTVNFISYAIYTGPVGTPVTLFSSLPPSSVPPFHFVIDLIDPAHIAGTVTINNFPLPGDKTIYQFVGKKNKAGTIQKLWLNDVSSTGNGNPPFSASILYSVRQSD